MGAFLLLIFFFTVGTWWLPLIDRDEPRFAEAAREMLERGDYVVPYFNGQYRFDKPPLIYWVQTLAYRVFGENEFAARLPSALFAAGTALLLLGWGTRSHGRRIGWLALVIFATSLQVSIHARAAVADMAMVFAMVLATWSGWEWVQRSSKHEPANGWWLLCWSALGLGFLAKGPVALLPAALLAWQSWRSREVGCPPWWQWGLGMGITVAIMAAWGVPALLATGGEFATVGLGKHVVGRSVVAMEGHGAANWWGYVAMLPFYLVTVFFSFFPWCVWLPQAVRHYWRQPGPPTSPIPLWCGSALAIFGLFTLVRTKLPHYTLPALPFMALLLAAWWEESRPLRESWKKVAIASAATVLLAATAGAYLLKSWFPVETLYRQAAPHLQASMPWAVVEYGEPSAVWTFRRKLDRYAEKVSRKRLAKWMAEPGGRMCLLPAQVWDGLPTEQRRSWQAFRAEGVQVTSGKKVELVAAVKK